MTSDDRVFVIVGASLAGATAAQTLREEGFTGRIVLIGEDPEPPYERPPLSKGYLLGNQPRDDAFVHPREWYGEHDIDLRTSKRVTAIEPSTKTVSIAGDDLLPYDRLLLATGAQPRRLEVPGADLPHVQYLRALPDSEALKENLQPGIQVLIIGAGWIGLEVAAAARIHGADVTVVEMDELPLRRVLGDEVAAIYRDLHEAHQVRLLFGRGVREIGAGTVLLSDGEEVAANLVVVGVGVVPDTELAAAAGLAVGNGVHTDHALRTSVPGIYACGDVAAWEHPLLGARIRVEHWENARQSGAAAARSMLDADVSYDWLPYFFSDQYDLGMEYSGWIGPDGYDRVIFRGDPHAGEFIAFWVAGGRVLAGMNANVWDVQDEIRALITTRAQVDEARLADPTVPLTDVAR